MGYLITDKTARPSAEEMNHAMNVIRKYCFTNTCKSCEFYNNCVGFVFGWIDMKEDQ